MPVIYNCSVGTLVGINMNLLVLPKSNLCLTISALLSDKLDFQGTFMIFQVDSATPPREGSAKLDLGAFR